MKTLNLLLKYKLAGDSRIHVKGATRIKVDGRGGLMLYDVNTGAAETINLSQLRSFSIQPFSGGKQATSFAAA